MYFARFEQLRARAEEYGVLLAQENVARCKSGKAAFVEQMAHALPQARFVLDVKQVLRAGEELDQMLLAMGKNIVHLHVSDHTAQQDCLLPGEGEMDFTQFVEKFSPWFTGYSVIEVYRHNFEEPLQLFKSNNFLQKILAAQS